MLLSYPPPKILNFIFHGPAAGDVSSWLPTPFSHFLSVCHPSTPILTTILLPFIARSVVSDHYQLVFLPLSLSQPHLFLSFSHPNLLSQLHGYISFFSLPLLPISHVSPSFPPFQHSSIQPPQQPPPTALLPTLQCSPYNQPITTTTLPYQHYFCPYPLPY